MSRRTPKFSATFPRTPPGPVRIYDTLREKVVPLEPLVPPRVGMFVCGLTPYKPSHIGHARTFVFFDTVARFLAQEGYHVFYVQNVTDIDDKILRVASEERVDFSVVAERNFAQYLRDMDRLGVRSVNLYARCTDYLPEILEQIQELVDREMAYEAGGDVYFDVSRFPRFGALSKQRKEDLQPGARVEVDPRKRSPEDFALWKSAKEGEPRWESPWGPGRPGWHIEDTAITVNVLGPRYDIHGGGTELKFPHHEAEIAQAESATGESPLASIWMHAGVLTMQGEKMSKSLGNVLDLSSALSQVAPDVLRFFLLSGLYRSPLEFAGTASFEEAERAYRTLERPYRRGEELWREAREDGGPTLPEEVKAGSRRTVDRMVEALRADFNIREATAALYGWSREVGARWASVEPRRRADLDVELAPYRFARDVLGYFSAGTYAPPAAPGDLLNSLVEDLLKVRQRARERGDFGEADRIREELADLGIRVEDSPRGPSWRLERGGT